LRRKKKSTEVAKKKVLEGQGGGKTTRVKKGTKPGTSKAKS